MTIKPLQIFALIMSVAYIFIGALFIVTVFAEQLISEPLYRKILGAIFVVYGLFRIISFLRKYGNLRKTK